MQENGWEEGRTGSRERRQETLVFMDRRGHGTKLKLRQRDTEVGGCDTYSGYKNTDYLVTEWMLGLMEREELGWQQDFGRGQLVIY